MTRPTSAVVVCAYTLDRWSDLVEALRSVTLQTPAPEEMILVIDHDDALLSRATDELPTAFPGLRVVANRRAQGLSGARNTAVEQTTADIVVFLDDDAAAEPGWLAALTDHFVDPAVLATGGVARPRWDPSRPRRPHTLPAAGGEWGELDWVVGCSYRGQPTAVAEVRNVMGCTMAVRRSVFERVGGFAEHLGRIGKTPLGCEETELCIRATAANPAGRVVFDPGAVVTHHVDPDRGSWRYLRRRGWAEGISKAAVAALVGRGPALRTERSYVSQVLPAGVGRELRRALRGPERVFGLAGALAIVVGFTATVLGYGRGRLTTAVTRSTLPAAPVLAPSLDGSRTA